MSKKAKVRTDQAVCGKPLALGAGEEHRHISTLVRAVHALNRLSPQGLFWLLTIGALAIAMLLTLPASLIAFRAMRLEILLTALPAGAIAAGTVSFTVLRVIGHLRIQQESLERYATVDELTGSPNRRVFLERLESEVNRFARLGTRLSVVFVDIDHFKRINDVHGHQVGDTVLKEIFVRLEKSLRAYDFVGRYGGDEFVMALPGNDAEGGAAVAERLRESIQESAVGKVSEVTISLGVAQLEENMNAEELLRKADMALYRAKNGGRNRTVMYPPHS